MVEGKEKGECFLKTVFLKEAVGFVRMARQIVSFNRYCGVPAICYDRGDHQKQTPTCSGGESAAVEEASC